MEQPYFDSGDNDDLFEHHRLVVDKGQTPLRIDKFLMDRLSNMSRNKIQNAAKSDYIFVNEVPVKANYKVRPGDEIVISLPFQPKEYDYLLPEDIPLDVRYEDDHILVINKPAGLVVHPGVGNPTGTLVNALVHHLSHSELPIKDGNDYDRPGIVHRIDKDTTGTMVVAKSELAMSGLAHQFYHHTIERTYWALVWGNFDEERGTIEGNIGRNPNNRFQMTVFEEEDKGKPSVTHYEVLEDLYYVSLVKCKLETGRTHQIRVHMKHIGHPLFNDRKYGGNRIMKGTVYSKYKKFVENCFELLPRQALHARSLGFIHPVTKEYLYFEQELPEDFAAVLERWRNYIHYRKENI